MKPVVVALALTLPALSSAAVVKEGVVAGQGFDRYSARLPGQERPITFYLSEHPGGGKPLPLVVWVQGTGCESHFSRGDDGSLHGGLLMLVREAAGNQAVVMGVEKPGVEFLNPDPKRLQDCPADFLHAYTLDRWAETIAGAITAAQGLPGVDSGRILVMGHSEGGLVAIRVSNVLRGVTHAASLSGGGLKYLFHIAEFIRRKGGDPEEVVYRCWAQVRADPGATDKFCWGGTYRQWASFMRTSIVQEALESKARLYFAHGSADAQNTVAGFDALRAEMAANGREAVFERIEGADHALDLPGHELPEGLKAAFGRVMGWFLATPENR